MKRFSSAMMFVGLVIVIIALSSDVAVEGYRGQRINNSGLMHSQLIATILGVAVLFAGLLIKIFGRNMNEGGYFQSVDELPSAEYWVRWITVVLAAACVWVLLVMYLWPSLLAAILLICALAGYIFMPQATYTLIKRVWMALMLMATAIFIFHLYAVIANWINYLTMRLFSDGVFLINNGRIPVVLGVLVVLPLMVSIAGFIFARAKDKRK